MSMIRKSINLEVHATLELNEAEIRALDALVGYGVEGFLKVFYEHMGRAYLQPHENGLRSLFGNIRETVPGLLAQAHTARKIFAQALEAQHGKVKQP